jgi:hypothetical protein
VNLEAGVCENWCHVEYLGLLSSDEVGNFFFTLLCFFAIFSFLNLVNNQLGCLYCFVVCLFFFLGVCSMVVLANGFPLCMLFILIQ